MCEIVIQIAPRTGDDLYKTAQLPQAGDVLAVLDDGHPWGEMELTNPDWRIVAMPGIPASDFANMLTAELPVDRLNPSRTLQYRAMRLDLTKVPNQVKAILASRTAPIVTVPAGIVSAIKAAIAQRPPVSDPMMPAPSATVVG